MHANARVESISLLFCLCLSVSAQAQDLRLFEEPESEEVQPGAFMPTDLNFNQGNGQPAYTLRSISRFGDEYQAVLINRSGEVAKLMWRQGDTPQVLNSGGFTVVAAGSSTISLQHPSGDSCVAAPLAGVACSAGDRSELRLVAAAPLPVSIPVQAVPTGPVADNQQMGAQNPFADPAAGPTNEQVFINPFSGQPEVMPQISEEERTGRAARQQLRAERLRQFEQGAVIDDGNIPEGMERVRTPFGDRLIPIRE